MTMIAQYKSVAASAASLTATFDSVPRIGSTLVLIANSTQGIATPAGWTPRASFAGDQGVYIWDKVSVGNADVSTTVTPNASAAIAVTKLELDPNVAAFNVASAVNGASSSTSIPVTGVTTSSGFGSCVLAIGAIHGWTTAPLTSPSYSGGATVWTHKTTALVNGTGATLVGHYVGEAAAPAAGVVPPLTISQSSLLNNTASFMVAYSRTNALMPWLMHEFYQNIEGSDVAGVGAGGSAEVWVGTDAPTPRGGYVVWVDTDAVVP